MGRVSEALYAFLESKSSIGVNAKWLTYPSKPKQQAQ